MCDTDKTDSFDAIDIKNILFGSDKYYLALINIVLIENFINQYQNQQLVKYLV